MSNNDNEDDEDDREAVALELEALSSILDDAFRIVGRVNDDGEEQGGTRVEIDIPDPSGGPASLILRATLPNRGYPSRIPPVAVALEAPHLSCLDAAAVALSLSSLERFVPGSVALFDWVDELRGREELFVVDRGGEGDKAGDEEDEEDDDDEGEESDDSEGEEEGRERPPSPPLASSFPSSSSSPAGTYTTVAAEHSATYEVKRSTFLATCFPIASAAEALRGVAARGDPSARHNCWAFVTPRGDDARSSDDGEPGGTAGRPILSSIAAPAPLPLRGVAVVVSRWKAGPKLGASGLARAYSHSARLALSAAPRVQIEESVLASVESVPLSDLGKVLGFLSRLGATKLGEEEEEEESEEKEGGNGGVGPPSSRITLSVSLPRKELEALRSAVASATSGRARVVTRM